jgi:hypothetical protein
VPKWLKFCLAILLLPVCAGSALAIARVIQASGSADTIWAGVLAGGGCWLAIYLLLPKPMWVYVFGHELTHALWTWSMGGKVKKFKASSKGGHVVVTKNNFLITLAPYFFPLYALVVAAIYALALRIWNWQLYAVWFHLALGAAYAFHLTLTWHVLQSSQSDITQEGYLFSAVVIFLGNAVVLLLALPLLGGKVGVATAFTWWWQSLYDILARVAQYLRALAIHL